MISHRSSWRQKVRHDVKKYVIALKNQWYVKNMAQSTSWRQIYIINTLWRQKVRHDVKNMLTSKLHHDVKIRHDYLKKVLMTSKGFSWRQKVCHDVKKYIVTSKLHYNVKNTSWRQKVLQSYIMTSKTRYYLKQFVMMLKLYYVVKDTSKMS